MAASDHLQPRQLSLFTTTLYRGEGAHDRPSYYTPQSGQAGGWWTTDRASAEHYARGQKGKLYQLEAGEHEARAQGARGYYFVGDPEVRKHREEVTE